MGKTIIIKFTGVVDDIFQAALDDLLEQKRLSLQKGYGTSPIDGFYTLVVDGEAVPAEKFDAHLQQEAREAKAIADALKSMT
jgi:hypothetical protein